MQENSGRRWLVASLFGLVLTGGAWGNGAALPTVSGGERTEISLSDAAKENIGIETEVVQTRTIDQVISVPATIHSVFSRRAAVSPTIGGRVVRVLATLGESVRRGQRVVMLESMEVGDLQVELIDVINETEIAKQTLAMQERLQTLNLASRQDLLEARLSVTRGEARGRLLRGQLSLAGMTNSEIDTVINRKRPSARIYLRAPIAGVITERNMIIGGFVEPVDALFRIEDLSVVSAEGQVPEADYHRAAEGSWARVRVEAAPGEVFEGSLYYRAASLDPITRTALVKVAIENNIVLRPQMFARMAIVVVQAQEVPAVPKDAVLIDGAERFVYVDNGAEYVRVNIVTGVSDDRYIEVVDGIYDGDVVVTRGNLELRTMAVQ
ncbi:MAG: efflux RND transporter periplasmic adaptor subunit [Candidatus Latescibacteria bacterium]|jgi:cobalt-zinc-cadmium efflux system membrane fusion protein|nr:efflux RND transporter periplasmic adaptor subunit [Candidatus Latescibacterota bacterium]